MDWGNDYFTFSDTNIEYIWRFLRIVHERGWLYLGHRSTEWCPRCGTSISPHELHGQLRGPHRPVALRPLPAARPRGRVRSSSGRRRPWTLPANVAAAVNPDAEYGLLENGEWVAVALFPDETLHAASSRAPSSSGCATTGPFDTLAPGARGRAPRDPVGRGLARRGHRHRPHRARLRRRGLRALAGARPRRARARRRGGPLLPRVRLAARPLDGRGGRADRRRPRRPRPARRARRRSSTATRSAGAATRR